MIGNHLVEEADANIDIAIVASPDAELGIYSHSENEVFERCHEIAAELGGGGHPTAAGCPVPLANSRALANYWTSTGDSAQEDILQAVRDVVEGDEPNEELKSE